MNRVRTAALAGASAIALGLGTVAVATPADAGQRGVGTVTVNETAKLVRKAAQERCLTANEARRIVRGNGVVSVVNGNTRVTFDGTVRSGILRVFVVLGANGCITNVAIVLR